MIITIELIHEGTTMMWKGELRHDGYYNCASGHNTHDVLNTLLSAYIMKKSSDD